MNKLFMSMVRIFKSADSEALADLADSIDIDATKETGMWPGNGARMHNVNVGPMESSSGSGASKMVAEYSDLATQTGLSDAYAKMAETLVAQGRRVESVEKSVVAIAGLLSAAMKGERFPSETQGKEGDEEDDKKDENSEDENTAKSGVLNVGNVPALIRLLSGASQTTGKSGLAPVPNLAMVAKAGNTWDAEIEFADSQGDHARVMQLRTLRMREQVVAATGATLAHNAEGGRDFAIPSPGNRVGR